MKSLIATVQSFVANLLLWSFFVAGIVAGTASGVVLDGTMKNAATYGGIAVSLLAGSRIAKQPTIKAFLSRPAVLWFLFLFNGGAATVCYFIMDGTQGIMAAAGLGLVSLGAAGGLIASRRKPAASVNQPAPAESEFS